MVLDKYRLTILTALSISLLSMTGCSWITPKIEKTKEQITKNPIVYPESTQEKKNRPLTEDEIKVLVDISTNAMNDLINQTTTFPGKYYSQNLENQIKNYLYREKYRMDDPYYNDLSDTEKHKLATENLRRNFKIDQIKQEFIVIAYEQNGVRKIIEKIEKKDPFFPKINVFFRCSSFVHENNWRLQNVERSIENPSDEKRAQDYVDKYCYTKYEDASDTQGLELHEAELDFTSAYNFAAYLNGNLIRKTAIGSENVLTPLPLKKGTNTLTVVLGQSQKDLFKKDDTMYTQIVESISGFSLSISDGDKKLTNVESTEGDQIIEQTFDY